jgi:hypothetical protein
MVSPHDRGQGAQRPYRSDGRAPSTCCPHCKKPIIVTLGLPEEQGNGTPKPSPQREARTQSDPRPWDFERARRFVMPIGKFRGSTMAAIAMTEEGRNYLQWGVENFDRGVQMACKVMLESLDRNGGDL